MFFPDLITDVISLLLKLDANKKVVYHNNIYSESVLIELMKYLEENSFPSECFDLHCPVSKYFSVYSQGMTPDLTVINPETMQPLAFFRTYDSEEDFKKDRLFDDAYHLNRHTNALLFHPYYIVMKSENALQFYNLHMLLRSGKHLKEEVASHAPIRYDILRNNEFYRSTHTQLINRNKLQKLWRIAFSVIVPMLGIVMLILDQLDIFKLTELRLVVFGIIIVSFLIPYLTQVTIKDFSVTFKEKSDKNGNNK